MPEQFALAPIAVLLLGVILELVLAKLLPARSKGWLAFGLCLASLGFVLAGWPQATGASAIDVSLLSWDGPVSLAYHIDGLSQLFAFMATGIGAAVLLYSAAYMEHDKSAARFYMLMLVFIAGLVHLVYSADMFALYLSWEVVGLCSFFLVGFWYTNSESAKGARKVLTMTHIAGYGLLAAIILIFAQTGTTLWTDPQIGTAFGTVPFLLMLLAAVAKSVQFPLHTWIPDAMSAPTPVSALLHAACYVKAGVYLVARMYSFGAWDFSWQMVVVWIGTITLLVGLFYAMIQTDLKRLLAFHTVSQIGYMMLGLGLGSPLGIAAALLHCFNHGLFKGGLFLCAGAVQQAVGTRDMDRMGGLARRMPKTAIMWLIAAGSIAGVPLLSGFASKWLIYNAALEMNQVVPALVAWFGSILTVFSFLKATTAIFLGDENPENEKVHEAPWPMLVGIGVLSAGSILLGVAPQLGINFLINPILPALGFQPVIGVSWLGMTTTSTSWFATGGLVLAVVSVAAGVVIYKISQPSRRVAYASASTVAVGGGSFTGGAPLSGPARLPAHDFSLMVSESLSPFYKWVNVDLYYLALWRALLVVGRALQSASTSLERKAPWLLVLAAGVFAFLGLIWPRSVPDELVITASGPVWPLVAATGVAFVCLVLTAASIPAVKLLVPAMVAGGGLAVAGLVIPDPLYRVLVLEAASLVTLALVWQASDRRSAKTGYLAAVLLSAAGVIAGTFFLEGNALVMASICLAAGFAVKLAVFPAYLWLPAVAGSVPAPAAGLIIAVVDVAAFGEVIAIGKSEPLVFSQPGLWICAALLSALVGAVLMLGQYDIKRLLAFSTIQDTGFLLLGVVIGGELGLSGAIIGASVHALAKATLFCSVALVEKHEPVNLDSRGLASRNPLAGAAFVAGALTIIGVPPTIGYIGHWRLFAAAGEANPVFLGILLLATALAVLTYARVIGVVWWGASEGKKQPVPALQAIVLIGLPLLMLIGGLLPGIFFGV